MKVFRSPFQNPFINLALEDYFLRGGADLPVLLFYVNRPCVVLGRFQNPWIECNLPYLIEKDIWLVRRQSGGGTVFHDHGNLNYCFIYPEGMIDRNRGVELIRNAFLGAEIELTISPRHDLWLDGRKISGSAFKQTKDASFHHGTFLVSSDLNGLEESLKHTLVASSSKSIASVRSRVIKLQEKYPGTEIEDVVEIISRHLKTIPFELDGSLLSAPAVQTTFRQLQSWEWMWGETPAFELGDRIIHKGMINGMRFDASTMKGVFDEATLAKYFPDFSSQHEHSQVIF